ncbi:MAG: hypothetical protein U0234_28040 [Sandaracinus sp.]
MRRVLVSLAFAAALSGCLLVNPPSGRMNGGDGGAALAPIPIDELCLRVAQAACGAYQDCCTIEPRVALADCVNAVSASCSRDVYPIVRDPVAGYDPIVAAEVIAEGRAIAARDCSTDIIAWYNSRNGLLRVMQGTVGDGMSCDVGDNPLAKYFSCTNPEFGCIAQTGGTFNCLARRPAGQPCFTEQDCVEADFCQGGFPLVGVPGTCALRLGVGETCNADGDCETRACNTQVTPHVCLDLTQDIAYCGFGAN